MKVLRKILLICGLVAGLSVAAMAQKDGDKKPPKPPPPVVNPAPPKPKGNDQPKKPHGAEAAVLWVRVEDSV